MTVTLSPVFGAAGQVFNNNGIPLSGGQIFTYLAGTSTNATTYTTSVGNIAHSNPIILDAAGRIPGGGEIWLNIGFGYKFVIEDSTGALIGTYDNIPSSAQPPAANDADSIMYEQGYTVTAGNFVIGNTYRILSVGNTDFVAIGAVSNTVGVYFIATGVGSGSGTAKLSQTVQYKLRQTISPKDFGAVGNGVTDDTAAIQAAVAYAQSLVTASPLYPSTKNIGGVIIDGGNANYAISAAIVENVGCITFANMCISPKFTSAGSYPGGYNACFVLGSGGWGTQQSVVTYRTNMTNIVISPGNYPYANYLTYAIIISGLRNAVFSNISVTQQFAAMWLENVSEVSVNDVFSVGNVYGYVLDSRMSGTSVLGFSYGWNDVANNNWNNCFATYSQHSGWVCMSIRQNRLIGCGSSYWNQSPLTTPPLGLPVATAGIHFVNNNLPYTAASDFYYTLVDGFFVEAEQNRSSDIVRITLPITTGGGEGQWAIQSLYFKNCYAQTYASDWDNNKITTFVAVEASSTAQMEGVVFENCGFTYLTQQSLYPQFMRMVSYPLVKGITLKNISEAVQVAGIGLGRTCLQDVIVIENVDMEAAGMPNANGWSGNATYITLTSGTGANGIPAELQFSGIAGVITMAKNYVVRNLKYKIGYFIVDFEYDGAVAPWAYIVINNDASAASNVTNTNTKKVFANNLASYVFGNPTAQSIQQGVGRCVLLFKLFDPLYPFSSNSILNDVTVNVGRVNVPTGQEAAAQNITNMSIGYIPMNSMKLFPAGSY